MASGGKRNKRQDECFRNLWLMMTNFFPSAKVELREISPQVTTERSLKCAWLILPVLPSPPSRLNGRTSKT